MTTKELKSYIDRILGNSIRCLLPSYWWRKALGAIVDKVEYAEKSLTQQIGKTMNFATAKFVYIPLPSEYSLPTEEQQLHNIEAYKYIDNRSLYGLPLLPDNPMVYLRQERVIEGFKQTLSLMAVLRIEPEGVSNTIVYRLYTDTKIYTLYSAGYVTMADRDDVGGSIDADTEMSDTSENPVQNKVIKSYVDLEVIKMGNDFKGYVDRIIAENEQVIAASLNDLNSKIESLKNGQ